VRRLSSKLHLRAEAVVAPGDPGHRRADERAAIAHRLAPATPAGPSELPG
jgi:hypothetical protein